MNTFSVSTTTYSGYGITKSVLDEIPIYGPICVVVDRNVHFPELEDVFKDALMIAPPEGEPTYEHLERIRQTTREEQFSCVVGLGGGSAMDYAKAIAALHNSKQKAIEYRGFDRILTEGVPCVCIPTTAGTGSEITPNAVFTDTETKTKLGINGRHVRPAYAILDAQWLETCPKEAATSALLDAFVHAVESYMSPKASTITKALSREAFRLLYQNALESNSEGKQNLLYGAYLAAMALCNTTSGVCGAMSYPLGVHFNIPHGYAGGIFLPDLVELNENRDYFCDIHPEGKLLAWRLSYNLRDLWMRLGVPKSLHQWGIDSAVNQMRANGLMDGINFESRNPVPFTSQDAKDLIARHV